VPGKSIPSAQKINLERFIKTFVIIYFESMTSD